MPNCPSCGAALEMTVRHADAPSESAARTTSSRPDPDPDVEFELAGRKYRLRRDDIFRAAAKSPPGPVHKYFVPLHDAQGYGRRYPIKQVLRRALFARYGYGFVEENYTAHKVRDILKQLGFGVWEA